MFYRIEYIQGNGYRCSCCRRTWDKDVEFETFKEVLNWYMRYDIQDFEDSDDQYIDHIYKINEKGKVVKEIDLDGLERYKKRIRSKTPNCKYCVSKNYLNMGKHYIKTDKDRVCLNCYHNAKTKQATLFSVNNFEYSGVC